MSNNCIYNVRGVDVLVLRVDTMVRANPNSRDSRTCGVPGCEICELKRPFVLPKEIVEAAENRKLVIFAGAGVGTEAKGVFNLTLYEDIRRELKIDSGKKISFSALMTLYCRRKTRRMLLHRIKKRFDYMKMFPEIYRHATRFHT